MKTTLSTRCLYPRTNSFNERWRAIENIFKTFSK